jgi:DNA-binding transcriptional ArsR family regulator
MGLSFVGEVNKGKILQSIAYSHPEGKTTSELVIDTKLDRDTIYTHGKGLKKNGLVTKNGKFGKYQLTEKAFGDPGLYDWLLGAEAVRKIMDRNISILNKFCKKYVPKDASEEQEILFIFALKIGALITYIMKEAMRPKNLAIRINNMQKEIDLKCNKKNDLVNKWVNNTISPSRILWEFSKLPVVKRGLPIWNPVPINRNLPPQIQKRIMGIQKNSKQFDPYNPSWARYEMNEDNFKKLDKAYKDTFPDIFRELEKIRNELPMKIDGYKKKNEQQ